MKKQDTDECATQGSEDSPPAAGGSESPAAAKDSSDSTSPKESEPQTPQTDTPPQGEEAASEGKCDYLHICIVYIVDMPVSVRTIHNMFRRERTLLLPKAWPLFELFFFFPSYVCSCSSGTVSM